MTNGFYKTNSITPLDLLPSDWDLRKCGDVVLINPSTKLVPGKDYPFLPMDAVDTILKSPKYWIKRKYGEYNGQKFKINDILFARITPSTEHGKTALITEIPDDSDRAFGSTELTVLRIKMDSINSDFLYYYLKSNYIRSQAVAMMEGATGRQRVPDKFFTSYLNIPIPPIQEQHRIASILSNVDETIYKTQKIIDQAQRIKQGLLQILLTKGIGHKRFKDSSLGEIPQDWSVTKFNSVIKKTQYGLSIKGQRSGDYPILRMMNISDGEINTDDLQYVDLNNNDLNKYLLQNGDILFNRTNSHELVGRTGLFDKSEKFVFASYLIRIQIENDIILPKFLNYYLNYTTTQNRIKSLASQSVSQSNINATKLRSLDISIPPIDEQKNMIEIIDTIKNVSRSEMIYQNKLNEIKRGLMQSLLTGKIRVKVDT